MIIQLLSPERSLLKQLKCSFKRISIIVYSTNKVLPSNFLHDKKGSSGIWSDKYIKYEKKPL